MDERSNEITYRVATPADAPAVGALHADSWQRHYRGAFADEYLDGPVAEERRAFWVSRLADPADDRWTLLAEADGGPAGLVGFVHVVFDADPTWGALLDNLHVRHDVQGGGVGRMLLQRAGAAVVDTRPGSGMYLWVLEQNTRAQAFYRSAGGREEDREQSVPPGGGTATAIRFVWPDPTHIARSS